MHTLNNQPLFGWHSYFRKSYSLEMVPPNVSGIALEMDDDDDEEEEGMMDSKTQKIGQVCSEAVHERLCRVLECAVKQSARRAPMNATVLDGLKKT